MRDRTQPQQILQRDASPTAQENACTAGKLSSMLERRCQRIGATGLQDDLKFLNARRMARRTASSSTAMPREIRCSAASNGTAPGVTACIASQIVRGVPTVRSRWWDSSERRVSSPLAGSTAITSAPCPKCFSARAVPTIRPPPPTDRGSHRCGSVADRHRSEPRA